MKKSFVFKNNIYAVLRVWSLSLVVFGMITKFIKMHILTIRYSCQLILAHHMNCSSNPDHLALNSHWIDFENFVFKTGASVAHTQKTVIIVSNYINFTEQCMSIATALRFKGWMNKTVHCSVLDWSHSGESKWQVGMINFLYMVMCIKHVLYIIFLYPELFLAFVKGFKTEHA